MMSPSDIEVLIHCHVCPRPHPRIDAPAVRDAINRFCDHGIIIYTDENTYTTTDRGKAWLQMILNTPFPTRAWVDKNGEVIDV